MKTVLGIDLGTQSLKTIFYDYDNQNIVATTSVDLKVKSDDSGLREQEASWWIDALHEALGQVDHEIKASVQAISVSGQQHGFVPLDSEGRVIYSVKLWCDTTTVAECDEITRGFGGNDAVLKTLGNPILPGYTLPKILWLKKNRPDIYASLDCILLPHDYLNFYLTRRKVMEYGDASGTGVLEIKNKIWNREILKVVDEDKDLINCLPSLISAQEEIGTICNDIAEFLGLPKACLVASGGGDNMMAAIGTGNVKPGVTTVSLGTSSTLFAYSESPVIDEEKGEVAAFCSSTNAWLPLICSLNCANAKEVIEKLLDKTSQQDFEEKVSAASLGADGVLTLPFYNGERSPYLPNGAASIFGLTEHNFTEENLLRSAIEGATYTLKIGLERLRTLGMHPKEIRVTGGGSNSATWVQMLADIFNLPVVLMSSHNGAAFGAALQALWLLQKDEGESIEKICEKHVDHLFDRTLMPNADTVESYQKEYERFMKALALVQEFY